MLGAQKQISGMYSDLDKTGPATLYDASICEVETVARDLILPANLLPRYMVRRKKERKLNWNQKIK